MTTVVFPSADPSWMLPHDPAALRECRLLQTQNVDCVRDVIAEVLQPHSLKLGCDRIEHVCHLDHLALGRVDIGTMRFGEMQMHVPEVPGYFLFLTCLSGTSYLRINGQDLEIDSERGVIIAPGEQVLVSTSPDCEHFFVRIEQKAVGDHSSFRTLRFERSVELRSPHLGPWLRQLKILATDLQTLQFLRSMPRLALDYERLLVTLLLAGQPHYDLLQTTGCVVPGSVKRAEEFIRKAFERPLALADIAGAAGVPTRTLLESFKRFKGTSPMRYLRDIRLDAARTALVEGKACTTTAAAFGVGISHLGRFARDYAERFGEQPSATLRCTRLRTH